MTSGPLVGVPADYDTCAELRKANAELRRALDQCVRYLADLNGSEWIKGDGSGEIDMRQRARNLQQVAFATLQTGG